MEASDLPQDAYSDRDEREELDDSKQNSGRKKVIIKIIGKEGKRVTMKERRSKEGKGSEIGVQGKKTVLVPSNNVS